MGDLKGEAVTEPEFDIDFPVRGTCATRGIFHRVCFERMAMVEKAKRLK